MNANSKPGNKAPKQGIVAMQAKQAKQRKILLQVGVAVVLVVLIAVIGFSVASKKSSSTTATSADTSVGTPGQTGATPTVVTSNGSLQFGNKDAKVVVTAVEDFQCPACKAFEATSGSTLTDLINAGTVAVAYRPIAFLDAQSTTQYSTRGANASLCVAQADMAVWPAWHTAMYNQQPEEGSAGLTNSQLVDIATAAGATAPDVATCINTGRYTDYVATQTKAVLASGVDGTPNVTVNDKKVDDLTPDGLRAAVAQAG